MVEHRTVCDVEVKVVSNGREAIVLVSDEYYGQYEVPIDILKEKLVGLIFRPVEQKDKRYRPRVEGFGWKQGK